MHASSSFPVGSLFSFSLKKHWANIKYILEEPEGLFLFFFFLTNMMAQCSFLWIFSVEQIDKIILLKNNLCGETNLYTPPPVNTLFLFTVEDVCSSDY